MNLKRHQAHQLPLRANSFIATLPAMKNPGKS